MAFWLTFFLFVGFTIIGELLRPKPKFDAPQPSGLGDFQVPTAEEGRPIPAVFGTVKLKGPNVVWYGALVVTAIKEKVKTGLFSSTMVTKGYEYRLGQQLVLCHGPIEFIEIRFDDRAVPSGSITIRDSPSFLRNDSITFGNGPPPWFTAEIPAGSYSNLTTLAQAAQAAMQAAIGTSTWRVVYGYEVQPGVSDEIHYAVRVTAGSAVNRVATLVPGIYETGALFADAVALALNTKEATEAGGARVSFACIYDGQKFTITATLLRPGFDGWRINTTGTYNVMATVLLGLQMGGADPIIVGFPSSLTSDFPTSPKRFHFGFAGLAGKLHLDPLEPNGPFDSATVFGLVRGGDVTITSKMGDYDRTLPGIAVFDSTDKVTLVVNAPTLFGGEDREGGIVGTIEVYKGTSTQTANDYLQAKIGALLPAYRGISYAVFRGVYVGNAPYLKLVSFVVRRLPNGLGIPGGRHDVNGDANPAAVVYDILTDARWGAGVATAQIDPTSFLQAADTLFAEGLGVSMVVDSQASARDLIAEILRHVDGALYADPQTGLLRLALARGEYNPQDLLLLDERNVDAVKISRPSWEQTTNVVKVRYIDRAANFTPRIAQAQDLANIEARGGEVSEEEFGFLGLSNAAAAQRTAARVLRTVAYPLAPIEVRANREAWQLRPVGLFRLRWGPYGILDMPCRVVRLRDGDLRDGKITIDAVEDVFGILWTAYSAPGTEWVDPIQPPGPLADAELVECPYALVVGSSRHVLSLGAAGTGTPLGYQVWSDPVDNNLALTNVVSALTPSGTMVGDAQSGGINYTATTIRVAPGALMPLAPPSAAEFSAGGAVLMIDAEMIAWQFMSVNSDGSYTFSGLVRGVMDTVPAPHVGGSRVWFISDGAGLVQASPYDADVTVRAQLFPFNALAIAVDGAEDLSLLTNQRAVRPYAPTGVLVNGASYPVVIGAAAAITVAWSHRNRLGTWVYDDAGATASDETGCDYTLRFYGEDGLLKRTYSALAATSQTWTTETADSGLGRLNNVVRFELESVRVTGAVVSFQKIDFTVWRDILPPVWSREGQRPAARPRRRVVRVRSTPGE